MKRFNVVYMIGKSRREAYVMAENLNQAEKIVIVKYPKWIDIIETKPELEMLEVSE